MAQSRRAARHERQPCPHLAKAEGSPSEFVFCNAGISCWPITTESELPDRINFTSAFRATAETPHNGEAAAASMALMSSVDSIRSRSISSAWALGTTLTDIRGAALRICLCIAALASRRDDRAPWSPSSFGSISEKRRCDRGTPELSYSHYQIHPAARSRCAATDSGFLHLIHAWHGPER